MGQLLTLGNDELQLAAAAGARGRARLRDLAQGLPSRGDGPLAALLGAGGVEVPGLPRPGAVAADLRADAGAMSSTALGGARRWRTRVQASRSAGAGRGRCTPDANRHRGSRSLCCTG